MAKNRDDQRCILGERDFHLRDPRSPGPWACVSVQVADEGGRLRVHVSPHGYRASQAVRDANPGAAALFGVLDLVPCLTHDDDLAKVVRGEEPAWPIPLPADVLQAAREIVRQATWRPEAGADAVRAALVTLGDDAGIQSRVTWRLERETLALAVKVAVEEVVLPWARKAMEEFLPALREADPFITPEPGRNPLTVGLEILEVMYAGGADLVCHHSGLPGRVYSDADLRIVVGGRLYLTKIQYPDGFPVPEAHWAYGIHLVHREGPLDVERAESLVLAAARAFPSSGEPPEGEELRLRATDLARTRADERAGMVALFGEDTFAKMLAVPPADAAAG